MAYVDGYVVAVPTENKEAFRQHASDIDPLFKKHGALQVIESWGDDIPAGENTDFYRAVKAKENETIVFSWVFWPDKETRDKGNDKVFADMQALEGGHEVMPFDGKRMIYGGFEVLINL